MKLGEIGKLFKSSLKVLTGRDPWIPNLTDEYLKDGEFSEAQHPTDRQEIEALRKVVELQMTELKVLETRNTRLEKEKAQEMGLSTKVARTTLLVGLFVGALISGTGVKVYESGEKDKLDKEITTLRTTAQGQAKEILELESRLSQQNNMITGKLKEIGEEARNIKAQIDSANACLEERKEERKEEFMNNVQINDQIGILIKEAKKNLPEGLEIKLKTTKTGRINIWTEFGGKRSIGYFADSEKFKDRLTKDGFKNWFNDRYNNHLLIGQIEKTAGEKGISLSQTTTGVYMTVTELYSGLVKVEVFDTLTQETGVISFNSKRNNNISGELDNITNGFLI